jgi:trimeric autotransporter adhesin
VNRALALVSLLLTMSFFGCGGGSGGHVGPPPPPTLVSLAVTTTTPSIAPGTTAQFVATGTFSDSSTKNLTSSVTWTSSAASVATISNTSGTIGIASAVAAGTSTITATSGSVSGNATLTVTNASLSSLAVTPTNSSIDVGTQLQLIATGTFSDGSKQDVSNLSVWTSSSSNIAAVTTNSGLATGKNQGTTSITATFGGLSNSTNLTVTLANLVSIQIKPDNSTIAKQTTEQLTITGTFSDGSTRSLTNQVTSWASSDTAVATITPSGLLTGVAPGSSTITANVGSVSDTTTVTVSNATLNSIAVAPSGATLQPSAKLGFTAVGTFSDGSTQTITGQATWASDNTAAATVSNSSGSKGVATGVAAGTTNISASMLGITGSVKLTVTSAALTSITVATTGNPFTAPAGTVQYTATGKYSDGSSQNLTQAVTWASSNTAVATINQNGLATGQGAGQSTISAKQGSIVGSTSLTVTASRLVSVSVISPNASSKLASNTSVQMKAVGNFEDGSEQDLTNSATWTSNTPAVATVGNNNGIVRGVSPGTVTISASFGSVPAGSISLTVTNAVLTSVTVTPASVTINQGQNQQFTATGSFDDGTSQVLTTFATWSSSNPGVAVVSNFGLATASGSGSTTIKAAYTQGGTSQNDTATLNVN